MPSAAPVSATIPASGARLRPSSVGSAWTWTSFVSGAEAAEAEPEVERRPEHADDVGGLERAAPLVREDELVLRRQGAPAGAVQEDRQPAVLDEEPELLPGAVPPDAAAGDDDRPLGPRQQVGGLHDLARVAEGPRVGARRRRLGLLRGLVEEDVHRQLEVDGAARLGERVPERGRDELRDPVGGEAGRRPLRDRLEDRELVELLQRALPRLDERSRAAEDDERRLRGEAVRDRGDDAGDARARGHDRDAAAAPDAAPGLRGVRGGLLVADVEDADPLEPAALVDRHHVPAREREDRVDALGCDRPGGEAASLHALGHHRRRLDGAARQRRRALRRLRSGNPRA